MQFTSLQIILASLGFLVLGAAHLILGSFGVNSVYSIITFPLFAMGISFLAASVFQGPGGPDRFA